MTNLSDDGTGQSTTDQFNDPRLRVVTLNIWGFGTDLDRRLHAIGDGLADLEPDVVCLQETWDGAARALADRLEFTTVVEAPAGRRRSPDNAVISRFPATAGESVELPGIDEIGTHRYLAWAEVTSASGRTWGFGSTHLAWGSTSEGIRLSQARAIDQFTGERSEGLRAVLGADLNAQPASDTVRYLTGLGVHPDGTSTQWLDAFDIAGDGPAATSEPHNGLAHESAGSWDIDRPDLLPSRRIDYVLVRGYRYGKPGCPLRARRVLDQPIETDDGPVMASDHYGVLTDLWDPR